jgi:uncharacterized membrane protein HdeD (DUF308 family)
MTASTLSDDVSKRATWGVIMGILTAAIGILMIAYPMAVATVTSVFIGWTLLFVGIAQIVFAFQSGSAGNFFLKILIGLLYAITGIALAFFPVAGAASLTLLLGSVFVAQAVLLLATAFTLRPLAGWGWFLADGIADALVGILILAGWPNSSNWAIGTLLGVAVLMTGISRTIIAGRIRSGVSDIQNFARGTA